MRRVALLALVAIVVAGCGGSGRLSATAYKARLATIAKEADAAQHDVEQGMHAKTTAELHSRLAAFAAAESKLGDEVAALKPPKDAEQANAALARAEQDSAAAVRGLLPRLAAAPSTKAALALLQQNHAGADAGKELDGALTRLHKLGYTQGS